MANDDINQDMNGHLLQGVEHPGHRTQFEHGDFNQQYLRGENPVDFQRYLQPNNQLLGQDFGNMDPGDLPGQQLPGNDNGCHQQDQGDMFGDEELIQIESNQENTGNNAAYQRSRPDGSPMFSQSSGFIVGDGESVVFRPVKQLDFSSLDETAMTEVILPRGIDRSASTPDHKDRHISMITREQFIENSGMDRNDSPDGNFFELKSSPNHSEHGEELDSKVIFSPLRGLNNDEDHFDPGMKSPPLSKQQNIRQHLPQNGKFGNHQNNVEYENFELTQQTIDETDIYSFRNEYSVTKSQTNIATKQSFPTFGKDTRSPIYSPSHGYSPHHHSISPSLRHSQQVESREIFVSVPQHTQYVQSPDSLNQSGEENRRLYDFEMNEVHLQNQRNVTVYPQQRVIDTNASSSGQTHNPGIHQIQNSVAISRQNNVSQQNSAPKQSGVSIVKYQASMQNSQNKDASKSQVISNTRSEVKPVERKPWNYAKGLGNKEPPSYMEKGAQKREVLAQHAKSRTTREDPKGKIQERNNPQPIKGKRDIRTGNSQSTENLHKVEENKGASKSNHQPRDGVIRGSQSVDSQNRYRGVPHSKENQTKLTREQHKSKKDYSPVTQVEQYSDHDDSLDVQGMEDVRSQLKSMLKISTGESVTGPKSLSYDFDDGNEPLQTDPYSGHVDYSVMSGNNQDNVSELLENFPSITACMWTDNSSINRNDVSVHNENTRLREILEKERYRRKHCEQQIQKLNIKLLETQQQLAVAVSTDKRKDIMIEQLDKQLGKVLEGWKNQDHEKSMNLEKVRQEKKRFEETIMKQKQVIDSFEEDMAKALDVVQQERDEAETTAEQLRSHIDEKDRNQKHAEEMLETEKEKCGLMKQELDMVKDSRDQIDKKFHQLQDRMYQEQDSWFKREQELLNKIDEVSEANVKILQQEKDKNEELSSCNKKMEEEIHEIHKLIKKMEMESDAVQREKESLKVEMGIMEAKFESAQRTLEAELASQMEKEIADQMTELQKRVEKADMELREKHFEHTKELNQRHKEDLEKHLANFHRQLKDKDDENRKQVQEYEEKLQAYRSEISALQESKQKLEKQRTDILRKLQQMMQSQWNEALSLLATTPQRKRGPSKLGGDVKSLQGVEFTLPSSNSSSLEGNTLQLSDLSSREQFLSASQRGNNADTHGDDIPVSTEVNMTDFQASLHMQQLLQSLSSLTTQPFPAYGNGPPVGVQENAVNDNQNQPLPQRPVNVQQSNSNKPYHSTGPSKSEHLQQSVPYRPEQFLESHGESHPASYPSSPNPKQGYNHGNNAIVQQEMRTSQNSYPDNSQQPVNYPVDETDEFNNHLHMLLNVNRPNVTSGHNTSLPSHSTVVKQTHRQTSNDSVDHWLRQSLRSQDSNIQSHDLNRSHASHVSSQKEDYISNMGTAVPIRPPQQHESFISQPESEPFSSLHPDLSRVSHQPPSACYSPPTKQTRTQAQQQDPDPLLHDSVRLTKDYNEISDKVEQHEYRQGELQHYIQMLLQKPPGDPVTDQDENMSLFSHDQTEDLDLNDTAQAAQIQKELSRIQELRDKPQGHDETDRKAIKVPTAQGSKAVGQSFQGVLQPEHLAEISRYLEKHKDHLSGKTEEDAHLAEIVGLLRNMQKQNPSNNACSPKERAKRNLKSHMSKVSESVPSKQETNQCQGGKPQGQPKKVERKVASVGPNRHIPGKGKNAWK